ncbi:hypothetical protein LPC08_07610 [Roseomonas sp. OT10]|uniref:hypothetical protein n=1 Tax=Roseomonas cutis TaxID=2897332 RepID=UPI001E6504ED|nr:hypothetical protein [Roseomonas sp. OT10]UFN50473.1 hypothetical protein LPC08_07610 [Roseomonas sp. OT10]
MRSALRLIGIGLACALAVLVGSLFLPHDRYIRFQDVRVESFARLGWLYERIHFDDTPIDVAFVGTSRTLNGIDPQAVERSIADGSGRCLNVTNLAIPSYGRNLHWLIVRELLENRRVGTLVLEVFENETRLPHPAFAYIAEVSDVLEAPMLINLKYFSDLSKLPLRQIMLAWKTLFPEQYGLRREFDPKHYDGPNPDNTRQVAVGGVAFTPLRDRIADRDALEREAAIVRANKNLSMLGPALRDFEFAMPRRYLTEILTLAKEKGVPVRLLYLPSYGQNAEPYDMSWYQGLGPLISAQDILADPQNWSDFHHMNMMGAAKMSERVGHSLGDARATPGAMVAQGSCRPRLG